MRSLSELVEYYGANGFVVDDAGNGCAGRCWVPWDDDTAENYGDVEMYETDCDDFVGCDWPHNETLIQVIQDVIDYDRPDDGKLWASEIIERCEGDFVDANCYRYRIIF